MLKEWAKRRTVSVSHYIRVVRIDKDGMPCGGGMVGGIAEGDATQGKYAMVRPIPSKEEPAYNLAFLKDEKTIESIRRGTGTLLNTFGTFRDFYPQDWSGYAKLRFDIKGEGSALRLRVEIEDSAISPPLRRVYQVPADKWVAVEFDLAEASRLREVELTEAEAKALGAKKLKGRLINLADMANFRITIEHLDGKCVVKLDNIRLVAAGAEEGETNLPVLTDQSSFPVPAPLATGQPKLREEVSGKLNRAPVEWSEPVEIPLQGGSYGLQPFDVAPVDNDRMLLAVWTCGVLKTADGGKTWTGLDGAPNKPTKVIDHDTNAPGRVAAAVGPDLMVLGVAKCTGGATPIDSYSVLTKFDGTDWKVQPRGLVDVDVRHCPEHMVNLVRLPNGRVWACWVHYNRFGKNDLVARYSDDEGASWRDASSNGQLQLTTRGKTNPYGTTWWLQEPAMPDWAREQATGRVGRGVPHAQPWMAPWGEQVVCAFVQGERLVCAFFDGTKWGAPQPTGQKTAPACMVHFDGKTVYLAGTDGKVYRLDGDKWVEDSPPGGVGKGTLPYPGCTRTRLSVAGKVLVACWTDGKKLFTSQKPTGGTWSEPREISNEEKGVHHIGAPARSVDNFVPFVWSITKGGARFVRIPVKQPGK
ncbi:MAG: carbohydrate binding domain-containing protein [Planctomycetota bacterium]